MLQSFLTGFDINERFSKLIEQFSVASRSLTNMAMKNHKQHKNALALVNKPEDVKEAPKTYSIEALRPAFASRKLLSQIVPLLESNQSVGKVMRENTAEL